MSAGGPEGLRAGVEALADEARDRKRAYPEHPHWSAWDHYESDLRALLAAQSGPEVVVGDGEVHPDRLMCQAETRDDCDDDTHWNPTPAEPRGDPAGLEAVLAGHVFAWVDGRCGCGWTADPSIGKASQYRAHLAAVIVEAGWKR